ncbi:MAG TPA: gephyrin-like molybdotransferase Glp [Longimicrobiaceae bacterium]|nr:gephyrin-like molybdotransferase Glp [Longimicrobiaceae bacterium]
MSRGRSADWISLAEARGIIQGEMTPLPAESRALLGALGSVLAEDVVSPVDLPPWDNSAMDGFAVRSADVLGATPASPRTLRVVDDVPAGSFPSRPAGAGEAVRVMTGAPVPEGADGVVRVEHTDGGSGIGTPEGRVRILSDADAGKNVRQRGEDVRRGQVVLRTGTPLRAAELGVAASLGRSELTVVRRPRVAVLTSGDELVEVEGFAEVLAGRKIVSSNSYALAVQLAESGLEARPLGIARDTPASLREHLERARGCDALVTTAGISVGEHDYVREVLEEMGAEVRFWRVRARPGSAFAFGRVAGLGGIPWFGLPGNPVSTMVTFEVLVRPALLRMCGRSAVFPPVERVTLRERISMKPGTTYFLRARLERDAGGTLHAALTGSQSSGVLTSMAAADGLLVVPDSGGDFAPGDALPAILLGGAPLREEAGY